jgi:hypothetical protein
MKSTAVLLTLLVVLVSGFPTMASDESKICVTVAGSCKIEKDTGSACRCDTPLGGVRGEPKAASNFDMSLLPTALVGTVTKSKPTNLDIQIFPKATDKNLIEEWLTSLDPKIKRGVGNPNLALANDDNSAIFFSEDAPKEAVRVAAISLIQIGVKIKSIQLYEPDPARNLPVRHNLIQVGATSRNRARQPLTASQVATAALPMFGDLTTPP